MNVGRLHVITDFHFQQRWSHAELASFAVQGGADTIQFRQKYGAVRHRLSEAVNLIKAMKGNPVPVLVNDDIALARMIDASGVHLGQEDYPVPEARIILGNRATIGATASTEEQALRAEAGGADYIGFGPIYPTRSKANPSRATGLAALESVCSRLTVPVIAIGGVHPQCVRDILSAGAYGIAVMTAISLASDPVAITRAFRQEIEACLGH